MTRLASTVDRFAAILAGLVLLALGAALVAWNTNWVPHVPHTIDASGLSAATRTGWWPWALAGVGIVLVVVALRWLFSHTPAAKVKSLPLQTNDAGSISIDLGEVAAAAGLSLEESFDVESAGGRAVIDRGTRTVDLTVRVAPTARAEQIISAIDLTSVRVGAMLGDPAVATRTTIHVAKKPLKAHRVR
jgi:hypothetical protein